MSTGSVDTGSLASLISGLFSGAAGIQQLTSNVAPQAAATASPFQSQYASYQPEVQQAINSIQANQSGAANGVLGSLINSLTSASSVNSNPLLGNLQNILGSQSNVGSNLANLQGMTGVGSTTAAEQASGGNLQTQLADLNQNYLSNPAIQSEMQTGIDTVNRGLAAQGLSGSGAQQAELQQYGENFAAQEYNQEYANLISGSNAVQSQNLAVTQEQQSLNQANFTNMSTALGQQSSNLASMASTAENEANLSNTALTSAAGTATNNANLLLNSGQGLLNSLESLSGATTGSPATAGSILSEQFGNTQTAIANLGSGATGLLSGLLGTSSSNGILSSLFGSGSSGTSGAGGILSQLLGSSNNGVNSLLGDLLGGDTTGQFSADTISGLEDSLGSSVTGGLEGDIAGGVDTGASDGLSALLGL